MPLLVHSRRSGLCSSPPSQNPLCLSGQNGKIQKYGERERVTNHGLHLVEHKDRNLPASAQNRWGVVLAGGDGTRLQCLTRVIYGDDRPKQFCGLLSQETLLRQTRNRAARSIPENQTIYAVTEGHRLYFQEDLAGTSSYKLVQPFNRGTAPAILLSLFHIAEEQPNALVAVLPCDHYYSNELSFTAAIESAFETAAQHRDCVVLLGAHPSGPEVEFGWIVPGPAVGENLFQVRSFEEKPSLPVAERLLTNGGLWNTFVMVGSVQTLLSICFEALPDLAVLKRVHAVANDRRELRIATFVYDNIPTIDFSRQILSPNASRLLVSELNGLDWHDLGQAERVLSVLRSRDAEMPYWLRQWETTRRPVQRLHHRDPGAIPLRSSLRFEQPPGA